VRRRRPDPRQGLFLWVWHDPEDDRPDDVFDDEDELGPPPLRSRVRQRHAPVTVTLWGFPLIMPKAPGRPVAGPGRERRAGFRNE